MLFFLSALILSSPRCCLFHFSLLFVSLGFPLSGDQSLGGLWSDWLSDWPHRLFHRHCGGAAGWDQIPSGQREYPEDVHIT